jgi:hypothetical protein
MEILELTQLRNPRLHIFWAGIFRSHVWYISERLFYFFLIMSKI